MISFQAGFAVEDITTFEPGMLLMGWAIPGNTADGVAEPLYARAMVLADDAGPLAFVCCDLSFVAQSLRIRVLELLADAAPALARRPERVVLTATHTHSGPSGISDYLYYNLFTPGHAPRVLEDIARKIVVAIMRATAACAPATTRVCRADLPLAEGVLFNRSLDAWNRNADVAPLPWERRDEAVDRTMTVLRVDHVDGRPMGAVCWLPVHGTCVHSDHRAIHPDNKGLAALDLQRRVRQRLGETAAGFVAIFPQGACGDVTSNYRYSRKRRRVIGRHDDDFESARWVAATQARHADTMLRASAPADERPTLASAIRHLDMNRAPVSPRFAAGVAGQTTRTARVGIGMTQGTAEGPGPLHPMQWINRSATGARRLALALGRRQRSGPHDPMPPFLDLANGHRQRWIGMIDLRTKKLPTFFDPAAAWFLELRDRDALFDAWIPHILPIQITRIGTLALVSLPGEPTTVAGRRIAEVVRTRLEPLGVQHVVVAGYSNAYAGYFVTPEEYALQHYEGASTHFGPWTLPALLTAADALAADLASGRPASDPLVPRRVPARILEAQAWPGWKRARAM